MTCVRGATAALLRVVLCLGARGGIGPDTHRPGLAACPPRGLFCIFYYETCKKALL